LTRRDVVSPASSRADVAQTDHADFFPDVPVFGYEGDLHVHSDVRSYQWRNQPQTGEKNSAAFVGATHNRGDGAVRRMRTRLCQDSDAVSYAVQRPRHSATAAALVYLNSSRLVSDRSWLKWL
jgi:hypothetical protein